MCVFKRITQAYLFFRVWFFAILKPYSYSFHSFCKVITFTKISILRMIKFRYRSKMSCEKHQISSSLSSLKKVKEIVVNIYQWHIKISIEMTWNNLHSGRGKKKGVLTRSWHTGSNVSVYLQTQIMFENRLLSSTHPCTHPLTSWTETVYVLECKD